MSGRVTRRWSKRAVIVIAALAVPAAAVGGTVTLTSGPIQIFSGTPTPNPANPYPSTLTVAGSATISNVRVTLNNFNASTPDTVDIALQGPGGQTVMILSDAGDTQVATGLTLIFDKNGTTMPGGTCEGALPATQGPWKPLDCPANTGGFGGRCDDEANPDTFPPPGPGVGPFGTNLGVFDNLSQTGDWKLWAVNDCDQGFFGNASLDGGWTLTITNSTPTAVKLAGLTASRSERGVVLRWRTADESDVLGFNVWRAGAGRVNGALVAAKRSGRPTGAAYRLVDTKARRGRPSTYRLQLVDATGARFWLGSVSLSG